MSVSEDVRKRFTMLLSSEISDIVNDPAHDKGSSLEEISDAMLSVMLDVIDLRTKELSESYSDEVAKKYKNEALNHVTEMVTLAKLNTA
jgi:hypothetical protein